MDMMKPRLLVFVFGGCEHNIRTNFDLFSKLVCLLRAQNVEWKLRAGMRVQLTSFTELKIPSPQ